MEKKSGKSFYKGGKWSGRGLASHVRVGIEEEANRQDAFKDVRFACDEFLQRTSESYRKMREMRFGRSH